MMRLGCLILALLLAGPAFSEDSPSDIKRVLTAIEYGKLMHPVLSDVSSKWNVDDLLPHLAKSAYDTDKKLDYIKGVVTGSSKLGKFVICNDMKVGVMNGFPAENHAVQGMCEFSNGKAMVLFVFVGEEPNLEIALFRIASE